MQWRGAVSAPRSGGAMTSDSQTPARFTLFAALAEEPVARPDGQCVGPRARAGGRRHDGRDGDFRDRWLAPPASRRIEKAAD